ncbi:hypothetical protein COT97_01295 [Candidatus Falkowbacteria bacterium CG10_big_fil_rev_8_21_14_0_10_39_11]|uniref:Uncharacterized protein n=1 Tax=Candidatus Falkowbacteria bacterium CG10_big_fil_rev_8_21_14_0_10_39_11 TaxID=1974565 RepID=A0A2H0V5X9_9BACT|nr:MAG: hypothetical protein COT97_01295 [Candidatus Falkowbacteria bacterium CG10_big_fil_rev_8_21_14_0_10_39_11]
MSGFTTIFLVVFLVVLGRALMDFVNKKNVLFINYRYVHWAIVLGFLSVAYISAEIEFNGHQLDANFRLIYDELALVLLPFALILFEFFSSRHFISGLQDLVAQKAIEPKIFHVALTDFYKINFGKIDEKREKIHLYLWATSLLVSVLSLMVYAFLPESTLVGNILWASCFIAFFLTIMGFGRTIIMKYSIKNKVVELISQTNQVDEEG